MPRSIWPTNFCWGWLGVWPSCSGNFVNCAGSRARSLLSCTRGRLLCLIAFSAKTFLPRFSSPVTALPGKPLTWLRVSATAVQISRKLPHYTGVDRDSLMISFEGVYWYFRARFRSASHLSIRRCRGARRSRWGGPPSIQCLGSEVGIASWPSARCSSIRFRAMRPCNSLTKWLSLFDLIRSVRN